MLKDKEFSLYRYRGISRAGRRFVDEARLSFFQYPATGDDNFIKDRWVGSTCSPGGDSFSGIGNNAS